MLVMAHGGGEDWNAAVEAAVRPLEDEMPTAVAFGMADPVTLKDALKELEARNVACITVVRLFMSSKSFLHQTEYLLGLRSDPPPFFVSHSGHRVHGSGRPDPPEPIAVDAEVVINRDGLLDAPAMGETLAQRAQSLSDGSGRESVIIIAHGPRDDAENEEWLRKLDKLADPVREAGSFETVEVATLREDWEEKRAKAEQHIRSFVEAQSVGGGRVLVLPFRLYGFGPYAGVLEGLEYEADGQGLLPSPRITDWIRAEMEKTRKGPGGPAGAQE